MRTIPSIVFMFLLFTNDLYAQQKELQTFGEILAESIMQKDSATFYSLVLPKEAVIERTKAELNTSQLSEEEIEVKLKNIQDKYDQALSTIFKMAFFNLTTKVKLFQVDLKNVKYDIFEPEEAPKDTSILAIHGDVNHETLKHLTFYVKEYKRKLYFASYKIFLSKKNLFEKKEKLKKADFSSDENGNLIFKGSLVLNDTTTPQKEILHCILNSPTLVGVEESSDTQDESSTLEYIKGQWDYTYYVNNTTGYAGVIAFKYEYNISDGKVDYLYYDFIHVQDESEFESIGQLPFEVNEKILDVFTREQYAEIFRDLRTNQFAALRTIS